ncbi:hypothetical protein AMEX_G19903 [Astyanax mexicanus]|uniref:Shelterin complex subunit TPP1/Est3 domain-containing protein n=1 Tax=Astyanax mexicanus TaxID=7994 RepID=A0A8T2LBA0_ASTMX|nr:hypothetical protein AMEX_G19903 [Astyanax mexicanus]
MRRYRRGEGEPEPWIERLIQNYGQNQRAGSLRAHVIGVSDLSDSVRTDESDACMLFLSDGATFIPAVLTTTAWESVQELEERENFAGLENTTVSIRHFQLNFHMDQELTSCQFYLTVNQMISVGRVGGRGHPPSCTTLPSIQQHILRTWRSLMKEGSVNSVNSQSAFPLSCLMGVWHNDIIMDILNDAIKKITTPTGCRLDVATPTRWHRERLRYRGEECFGGAAARPVVSGDRRGLLTAERGSVCRISVSSSSSDTPSRLAPPRADVTENRPVAERDGGVVPPPVACDRPAERQRPEAPCGGGGGDDGGRDGGRDGGGGRGDDEMNPWDMFCPAPDLLGTPSSSPETSIGPLSQESQSLLPTATSTWAQSPNHSAEQGSGSSGDTPYPGPHPYLHSSAHVTEKTTPTTHRTQDKQQALTPPTRATKGVALHAQDDAPKDPSFKRTLQTPAEDPPPKQVHSDGSRFSYMYEPSPQLLSAFSLIQVPEQLVQWAVVYLGTSRTSELRQTSARAELQRSKDCNHRK